MICKWAFLSPQVAVGVVRRGATPLCFWGSEWLPSIPGGQTHPMGHRGGAALLEEEQRVLKG